MIQQEQSAVKERTTIKPRFNGGVFRKEFLKILNRLALEGSKGKLPLEITKENERVIELICQYGNSEIKFEENEDFSLDKGIIIYGNFGSGKTLIMTAYAEIMNKMHVQVGIKSCNDMNILFREEDKFSGKRKGYTGIAPFTNKHDKVQRIFDDLGEEEITINDFGNKVCIMAYIFGERYKGLKNGVVTHCTSNLDRSDIGDDYGGRIESRGSKMFNWIKLGASKDAVDYRKKTNKILNKTKD